MDIHSTSSNLYRSEDVFKLRNHPDAEPHFHELARQMQEQVEYVNRLLKFMILTLGVEGL